MSDDAKPFLGYLCSAAVEGEYATVCVTIRRFTPKDDGDLHDSNTLVAWRGQANVMSRRDPERTPETGVAFICANMYNASDADWTALRDDVGHWYALHVELPGNRGTIQGAIEEIDMARGILVKIGKALDKFHATYPEARHGDELQELTIGLRAAGIVPIRQCHENYTTTYRVQA